MDDLDNLDGMDMNRKWHARRREARTAERVARIVRGVRMGFDAVRTMAVALALSLLAFAAAWAFLGFVGIACGSTDACTESFRAATCWAFGR